MRRSWWIEMLAGLLIVLFVYASVGKLVEFETFQRMLRGAPMVGEKYVWVSVLLPAFELLIAVWLLVPRWRRLGFVASFWTMLFFTGYIGYLLLFRRSSMPCSCGGLLERLTWKQHLVFNILFTLVAYIGMRMMRRSVGNLLQ